MTAAVEVAPVLKTTRALDRPIRILPVPWRDPHSVSPQELREYIEFLEKACQDNPKSADLRTCLGMAYAMNYQAQKSMDVLEAAVELDGTHFFAQLKYSELLYRLRALQRAEVETVKALDLAGNTWELSLARKQLQEIRRLMREGTQRPEWNKPLKVPSFVLMSLLVVASLITVIWK
jgi:tetratricopeptide (TPR) repeat protein